MNTNVSRVFGSALLSTAQVWMVLSVVMGLCPSPLTAAEEKKSPAPPTHKAVPGVLKSTVQLDAVFESADMHPLQLAPKAWTDLTVLEAVPHGKAVKQGEVLVRLDLEKIEEQIRDLEQSQLNGRLAMDLAAAEYENLKETTPLKLEAARRSKRRATEDFAYFEQTDQEQRIKGANFSFKSAEERLANAREELEQLKKMYEADDLTEESEEIILKRQKFAVESAEYFMENSKLQQERSLNTLIPRERETLKAASQDQDLALNLAEISVPNALNQKELALAKLKQDQKKAADKLGQLKGDLDLMTNLKAPADGIVYFGACEGGRWVSGAALEKKLTPGGKLASREVFMTVVDPKKLQVRATVPEKDLARLETGLEGKAAPVVSPDKKLTVEVRELGSIPLPGGGFQGLFSVQVPKNARVVPGMNCKLTFERETKSQGVLVPKEAVFTEAGQAHVYVLPAKGDPEKKEVKTGDSDDKMTDIVDGLSRGDKVLLKKPE